MEKTGLQENGRSAKFGMLSAATAAVGASLCCVVPLVLLALGVSGAWIGSLTALEPYRPLFIVMTLGFLGFAFYKVYKKPEAEACAPGSYCANPRSNRINKIILWSLTVLSLGLLAFPYIAPQLLAGREPQGTTPTDRVLGDQAESRSAESLSGQAPKTVEVVLDVRNMTCAGCSVTVTNSLTRLEGVADVKVIHEPPKAIVVYDPDKVSPRDLIEATTNAGYPSSVKNKGEK